MLLSDALLFAATASAAAITSPLTPRAGLPNGQTTVQDVINIHNAVLELDAIVQDYTGSPFPTSLVNGVPVLEGVFKIHNVNRVGFVNALAALPYSKAEDAAIVQTVEDTVNVSIPAATVHLKAKLKEFQEGALGPVVVASLALLLSDHDTFSAAVATKLVGADPDVLARGLAAVANIHNAIQDALLFYTLNVV
ncbi:hypothetical protein EJ05DRAFT_478146 [Pseudovirgaria hyperparasitica]|uniref:Uncharacterized protein n=1 Tax=Pseudovirgaria hyperparasitica TaxID=470096 RepID=A0A6A6W241_9PEZI|nr:uncharacterized protein EJ05DRAFT_478146 [Pseudovirgaria hyperparasitica]KAF2756116.1 hypothetical protein EJ05DRAFT_478146 [Pseudovirgaria hyperparasitica]